MNKNDFIIKIRDQLIGADYNAKIVEEVEDIIRANINDLSPDKKSKEIIKHLTEANEKIHNELKAYKENETKILIATRTLEEKLGQEIEKRKERANIYYEERVEEKLKDVIHNVLQTCSKHKAHLSVEVRYDCNETEK